VTQTDVNQDFKRKKTPEKTHRLDTLLRIKTGHDDWYVSTPGIFNARIILRRKGRSKLGGHLK